MRDDWLIAVCHSNLDDPSILRDHPDDRPPDDRPPDVELQLAFGSSYKLGRVSLYLSVQLVASPAS